MTSPDSCRMGEIEGVGTVGLEYVGRMLGGWVVIAIAWVGICWRWRNSMGAEWATMGTFC